MWFNSGFFASFHVITVAVVVSKGQEVWGDRSPIISKLISDVMTSRGYISSAPFGCWPSDEEFSKATRCS